MIREMHLFFSLRSFLAVSVDAIEVVIEVSMNPATGMLDVMVAL